ncbi:MAG: hypothetical protein A3A51_03850 [Candidatus Levybacteria bacterium RIFCSPLOWO2_01_FULL_39_10]|nr:MAG: hypothetical protein A3A51_03850 [Candidatus Levybacteria bacterium RIFCSPLOWO2_01_FULL_39_10]
MKFKNTKNKKTYKKAKAAKAKKFPSNYLNFPEGLRKEELLFVLGILTIFTAILIISADIYTTIKDQKRVTNEKVRILNEISFWENEVKEKPNFRDAYFNLALLNYEIRKFDEARVYLNKVFSLDPDFEEGRRLEEIIESGK